MKAEENTRVTVDLDGATIARVMAITGEKHKSPAIAKAVTDFVNRATAKEFGARLREGAFDYPMSDEEIAKLDS